MCCGQGRAILRASLVASQPRPPLAPARIVSAARAAQAPPPSSVVSVRYLGAAPIVVRGAISGRAYRFALGNAVQAVDARDMPRLLQKGIFRRHA